ncbi:MAG: ABC transporter ATP-binding protein [Pseudomonadota bacterium]
MISVRNLRKDYDGTRVLERISIDIEKGSFCTIVGASGCGKSTFLRIVLGQERQTAGEIFLDGAPLATEPSPDRGIVFQRYSVFPNLTVRNNLLLPADFRHAPVTGRVRGTARAEAEDRADALLERCGLTAAATRYPAQLSGGMQQRLALAQALMLQPRVLLLDEPFGALDPGVRSDMHELLGEFWDGSGMTVLMVTHDIQEAFKLGTRLLVFDKIRHDPHDPSAFGATITYDLPIDRRPVGGSLPNVSDMGHADMGDADRGRADMDTVAETMAQLKSTMERRNGLRAVKDLEAVKGLEDRDLS